MNLLGSGKPFDLPAIIKDPFGNDKLETINLTWYRWNGHWTGRVGFKNGNTSGDQTLIPGDDLDNMVAQIKAIMESLNNKK